MRFKAVTWIIIINIVLFGLTAIFGIFNNDCTGICKHFVLQPKAIFENYSFWTLLISMFMHGSFAHLFFNMFSLFFIGGFVEKIIGSKRFVLFYLLSGIFAGLFFSILSYFFGFGIGEMIFGNPEIIAVGASGALFGLLGLLAVITPRSKVYLIAGPLIAIILQAIIGQFVSSNAVLTALNLIIMIYIFISIFLIFSFNPRTRKLAIPIGMPFWFLPIAAIIPLIIIGLFIQLPIGNMAHLGGLVAGLLYGAYLRNKYPKKIKLLNHSMGR